MWTDQIPFASYGVNEPEFINQNNNIIAGPGPREYYNHSPGAQKPMEPEEQPFPIQGNIGSLLVQEGNGYQYCSNDIKVSGSPNCIGVMTPDEFTLQNTCGINCNYKMPEAYGAKDFGMDNIVDKYTDAHGIHAYENERAGSEGQMAMSGCYEFIPGNKQQDGVCISSPRQEYQQVGYWPDLNESLINPKIN